MNTSKAEKSYKLAYDYEDFLNLTIWCYITVANTWHCRRHKVISLIIHCSDLRCWFYIVILVLTLLVLPQSAWWVKLFINPAFLIVDIQSNPDAAHYMEHHQKLSSLHYNRGNIFKQIVVRMRSVQNDSFYLPKPSKYSW